MPAYGVGKPENHDEELQTFGETCWSMVAVVDVNVEQVQFDCVQYSLNSAADALMREE